MNLSVRAFGRLFALAAAAILLFSSAVSAQSVYGQLDTPFYDPNGVGCDVQVDVNLSGNTNAEIAFNFFFQKGLTAQQSAGIVGNLMHESHVNPSITNEIGAHGIAQWLGGRLEGLGRFAQQKNMNRDDLGLQLEYIWYEMGASEKSAGDDLKSQETVDGAAISFFEKYERAGDSSGGSRVSKAKQIYNKYSGGSIEGDTVSLSSGACVSSSAPGQNTKYIEGFTVYSQYDPAWVNRPYSSSTIGASGCGPSAMAMVITALTGRRITPVQAANYAASQGMYVPGEGSKWSISPVLAEHWGLKSENIGANIAKITATLQAGGLVVTSGQGPKPFTSGGHFIVIRAVTADGKWKVGDSGHNDTSDLEWEPAQLIKSVNPGSVYAITK